MHTGVRPKLSTDSGSGLNGYQRAHPLCLVRTVNGFGAFIRSICSKNPLTACHYHPLRKMSYYNARYYDPVIGTFISPAAPVASSV